MKVSVIGTGYVGLVTGIGLAKLGHQVICCDKDRGKIEALTAGRPTIWEPGVDDTLEYVRRENRIRFTTNIAFAVRESEVLIIAVGTPSLPNGDVDLSHLWDAAISVSEHMNSSKLLVIKSTVPVGTTDSVAHLIQVMHTKGQQQMDVVHNPEFLRQGSALHDFFHPDRIIVGCRSEESKKRMSELYSGLAAPIQNCSPQSAELIKYAANAFLAMKISYINMFAELCEQLDATVDDIARGIGMDPRIGTAFLQAGVGYGGSCFPKDIRALRSLSEELNWNTQLLEATERINRGQSERLVQRIADALGGLAGRRITLLGLAFKPNTDDIREAPSLRIAALCCAAGAEVHAYDPVVRSFPDPRIKLYPDACSSLYESDAAVLLTEWPEFRDLDWAACSVIMRNPILADGRNLYSQEEASQLAEKYGMQILSVGRPIEGQLNNINNSAHSRIESA